MKRNLITILTLLLLTACSTAPTATLTPTSTNTPEPTQIPTATEVAPGMENLPAEWKDKIDRVETMTNMDGSTRTVAIAKLSEADMAAGKTESKLRVLQWDEEAKGWVEYVPQVGWAGWGSVTNEIGTKYPSLWDEDLVLPDMGLLKEPLKLNDGTKVPMGYLGRVYMMEDKQGEYIDFFQGYILEMKNAPKLYAGDATVDAMTYLGIPLETGDWEVYVSVQQDGGSDMSIALETLSLSDFGKNIFDTQLDRTKPGISTQKLRENLAKYGESLVGEPIIQGVYVVDDRHNDLIDADDQAGFIKSLQDCDPRDFTKIMGEFSPAIVPQAMWAILSQ